MHPSAVLLALILNYVKGYPNIWAPPKLNPVHSLYVKPSTDGVTGDLYVAATEDNGVNSQWVVDQPVNYLPVGSRPHSAPTGAVYPGYPAPLEDNQKRAVPPPSPPVQYAYAMPMPTTQENPLPTYPYAYPVASTTESSTKCESSSAAQYPYQFPYQYFYPQMMSAYTNAMSILKEAGLSDDTASSVMAHTTPTWPPSSYAYPMYVMVDPNAWAQSQGANTSTPATASSTQSEENTQS